MSEFRTIILGDDGLHVTVGRHREPSADEIALGEVALKEQGHGGWLCRMEGSYYRRGKVRLTRLQTLGTPAKAFSAAESRFEEIRQGIQGRTAG